MPQVNIDSVLCTGCRACAAACPEDVIDLVGDYLAVVLAPDKCTACMLCEEACPEIAIRVEAN